MPKKDRIKKLEKKMKKIKSVESFLVESIAKLEDEMYDLRNPD